MVARAARRTIPTWFRDVFDQELGSFSALQTAASAVDQDVSRPLGRRGLRGARPVRAAALSEAADGGIPQGQPDPGGYGLDVNRAVAASRAVEEGGADVARHGLPC